MLNILVANPPPSGKGKNMARTKSGKRRGGKRRPSRKPRKRARARTKSRSRNARGWFGSRGKSYGRRGKSRSVGKKSGRRRVYTRPVKKSTLRKRAASRARKPRRRRRNPNGVAGRPIFGLKQLANIPLIGPLFREDVIFTGVGVATGLGLIPKLEGQVLKMAGVAPDPANNKPGQAWYTALDEKGQPSIGKRVMDTALPTVVGSAGAMAALAIKGQGGMARFMRNFSKGFAIAGIGIGVGRLLDWLLWPRVPEQIRPAVTTAMPALGDYAQASGLPTSLGQMPYDGGFLRDYATTGTGFDDYAQADGMQDYAQASGLPASLGHYGQPGSQGGMGAGPFGAQDRQRGESLLEGGGEEAELAAMTAEMRTF